MKFRLKRLNASGVAHHALIAIMVVVAVGAFGAWRINASRASINPDVAQQGIINEDGCPPGYRMVDGECKQLNKEENIKEECDAANAQYDAATKSCKPNCQKGYYLKDNACVQRGTGGDSDSGTDSTGGGTGSGTDTNTGGTGGGDVSVTTPDPQAVNCKSGEVLVNGSCEKKVSCGGENVQYDPTMNRCVCVDGYSRVDGKCKKENNANCTEPSILINGNCVLKAICEGEGVGYDRDTNTCYCIRGYHKNTAGTCVKNATEADVKARCAEQFKQYDAATNKCKDNCVGGYTLRDGTCQFKPACDQAGQKYDEASNSCKCQAGYYLNAIGGCNANATNDQVRERCAAQFRQYDREANRCKDNCVVGYYWNGTGCEKMAPESNRPECTALHLEYDKATNSCKDICREGYVKQGSACVKEVDVKTCKTKQVLINGQCQDRKTCDAANTVYDEASNSCRCQPGFSRVDMKCQTTPSKKAECDAKNLQYVQSTDSCSDKCKAGFVLTDGVCKDRLQNQNEMSERLCNTLGRFWTYAPDAPNGRENGVCLQRCLDDNSVYVAGTDNTRSYCTGGVRGVTTGISQAECEGANNVWLAVTQTCSAKCKKGYYAKDGVCLLVDVSQDAGNGDGVTEDGGCVGGLEPNAEGVCLEDVQSTDSGKDTKVVKVDTDIRKDVCELLGREWENKAKDAEGNVISGCKVECNRKIDNLVKPDNGKPFCRGYVSKIDKNKCEELNRMWLNEARACAVRANQDKKPGTRIANADQCKPPFTTYVYKDNGGDECLRPSTVERLLGIAKATGTPFVALTNMGKAGICNVMPKKHWNGSKCVDDKPAVQGTGVGAPLAPSTNGGSSEGDASAGGGSGSQGGNGQNNGGQSSQGGNGVPVCIPGEGRGCTTGAQPGTGNGGSSTNLDNINNQRACEAAGGNWSPYAGCF